MNKGRDHRKSSASGGILTIPAAGERVSSSSSGPDGPPIFYDADGQPLDQKTLKTAALNLRRQFDARRRDQRGGPAGPVSRAARSDDNPTLILRTLPPAAQAVVDEARRVEAERLAEEARLAEEFRLAEEARLAEKARLAEEMRLAEEARLAAEAKQAEEARLAAEAKQAEDAKKAAEAKQAEDAKKAAEAKQAEEAKKAAEAKQAEDAKKAAEAKQAEEAKKAAEAKQAEDAKKAAEATQAEDAKKAAEAKQAEEAKKAAEAKQAEDAKKAAEAKQAEEAKKAAEILASAAAPPAGLRLSADFPAGPPQRSGGAEAPVESGDRRRLRLVPQDQSRLRRLSHKLEPAWRYLGAPVWARPRRRFLLLTLLPTLLVLIYTLVLASPMYISTSMFAITDTDQQGSFSGGKDLASLFVSRTTSTVNDSYLVTRYIHSWDLFDKIDQELGLRAHFSHAGHDPVSRLAPDSTQADILKYWRRVVKINFDPDTGIISCKVRAFSPEMAWRVNDMILTLSEKLITDMKRRGRLDALKLAENEVRLAETRLSEAHASVRRMREQTSIIDPKSAAGTLQTAIDKLEVEAVEVAAALGELKAYMREDSAQVVALQRRLEALQAQLAVERSKLSEKSAAGIDGQGRPARLVDITGQFEDAQLEEEFARQYYASALATFEAARLRNESQTRYLVAFEPALLPDESLYPNVPKATLLTFMASCLILAFLSLIGASIREHAGF